MNVFDLQGLITTIWATPGVATITYSVLLNLVLAWAVAIKNRTFTLQRILDFATGQLIPYVSIYVGALFLGSGAGYGWLGNVAYTLVLAKMGASILANLKELGVPVPDAIMPYVTQPSLKLETVPLPETRPYSTTTTTIWQSPEEVTDAVRPTSGDAGAKG